MITITALAKKLGVSRTTIYKHMPNNIDLPKVDGITRIDEELEKAITDTIINNRKKTYDTIAQAEMPPSEKLDSLNQQLIDKQNDIIFYKEQLNQKDKQLQKKDKQIEQLNQVIQQQQFLIGKYTQVDKNFNEVIHKIDTINNVSTGKKRGFIGRLIDLIQFTNKVKIGGVKVGRKTDLKVTVIGEDSNIFNLLGIVTKELKRNGYRDLAKELPPQIFECNSYDQALAILDKYVELV